jgi:hypothetical protein
MPGQIASLTRTLIALAALLIGTGAASAHRLVARCKVLSGKKVLVSARYQAIPRSIPAALAQVKVFGPERRLLIEGETDEEGRFVFSFTKAELLEVEVYQDGHLGKDAVSAERLSTSPPGNQNHRPGKDSTAVQRLSKSSAINSSESPNRKAPADDDDVQDDDWSVLIIKIGIGAVSIVVLTGLLILVMRARRNRSS